MIFKSNNNLVSFLVLSALLVGCKPNEKPEPLQPTTENTPVIPTTPAVIEIRKLENIDGFWVPEKYLDSLRATRNPFSGSPESIEINTVDNKIKWTNFHEGYWRNIFEYGVKNDSYFLKVSEPESSTLIQEPVYFVFDNGALIFNERGIVDQINERFTKIPVELPKYANQQILAGKYKDEKGKQYEFTESGKAIWPGLSFEYEFVLDSSEADCPYINSSVKKADGSLKRFGYKWESEVLFIFEIVEDGGAPISCAKDAYLKLIKK
ncbi:MAG: hypothetical protein EOO52_00615 [Gammaproteobacteria bacterium]|nr:MAG: hypothetical protein EOO52_00615 [Gammaproteobacteria bacterium]